MPEKENTRNIFLETLDWICAKLESLQIPYMVTGGSAVGFWGHIRTTMDIDIVIQINKNQVEALFESVKKEAYVDVQSAEEIEKKAFFNIIPNKTLFKIDVIVLDSSKDYEVQKFERRIKINFLNKEIYVISPEDLIISKLMWGMAAGGSERQIKDSESVWKINEKNLDLNYISKWVDRLNIGKEFEKLKI
jgi:hypothetical protein